MANSQRPLKAKEALDLVVSQSGLGVYASADRLFKGAVFGRDSLEVAEDLLPFAPKLVRVILLSLAGLQGLRHNLDNEEEPGKIHHEFRSINVDGHELDATSQKILEQLADRWGGTQEYLRYYGSVDATPLFVRCLCRYVRRYGRSILKYKVTRYDGSQATMQQAMQAAVDWIIHNIDTSPMRMVSYKALNKRGIENQVWKDSKEFYVHADGQLANHRSHIASIEVQGYAYDALILAAKLLNAQRYELQFKARQLRSEVIENLWMPEHEYFALGMDIGPDTKPRAIKTLTANPATLLDSNFFKGLESNSRQKYISGIVTMIFSKEFLTDAGIRSRSLSQASLVPFWDYHGSYTTWPKETYDVSKGLRRYGFNKLATQLDNRLLNVVRRCEYYPEFIHVDALGKVLLKLHIDQNDPKNALPDLIVNSTNHPETLQAWTISAVVAIEMRLPLPRLRRRSPVDWQTKLESLILKQIPKIPALKKASQLKALYPRYPYRIQLNPQSPTKTFIEI